MPLNNFTILEALGKSRKIRENKSSNYPGPQSSVAFYFRDPPGFSANNKSGKAQNHQRKG